MSEVKRLRELINDLLFFIENGDDYIGDLTPDEVKRTSVDYMKQRVADVVNWVVK